MPASILELQPGSDVLRLDSGEPKATQLSGLFSCVEDIEVPSSMLENRSLTFAAKISQAVNQSRGHINVVQWIWGR